MAGWWNHRHPPTTIHHPTTSPTIHQPPSSYPDLLRVSIPRVLAGDVLDVLIVLVADVLEQIGTVLIRAVPDHREGPRVRAWIVDGDLVVEMIEVRPAEALDDVQLLGVRMSCEIEPEAIVEAHLVHDERVPLPAAD